MATNHPFFTIVSNMAGKEEIAGPAAYLNLDSDRIAIEFMVADRDYPVAPFALTAHVATNGHYIITITLTDPSTDVETTVSYDVDPTNIPTPKETPNV